MARVYDRIMRQRLSRRRLLAGAGGAALGTAAIAACGGGDDAATSRTPAAGETPAGTLAGTPAEGEITKDGVLHAMFSDIMPTLDLFGPAGLVPNIAFGYHVFDHLFYSPLDTQKPEPMLAYEWENPDEQGLETIFKIHETAFHDKPPVNGRAVLASDVKASYEAYAADSLGIGLEWHRSIMEAVEAPDDLTVVIKQNRPYAWLFHAGGAGSLTSSNIIPVEALVDPPGFNTSQDLIGSGRSTLVENRSFEFFRGERHPGWRVEGEPYTAGWTSVYIGESAQAQATFRAGDIDEVPLANKLEADEMVSRLGDQVVIASSISREYHTLMLNLDRVPAFQDIRVRKALNRAINRAEMIQLAELDAEGGVPAGPIPPALAAYALPEDGMEEYFRHDPEEAKQLLEEADFPFDKELTIIFPTDASGAQQKRAQLLKEQFEAVGLKVKIVDQDVLSVWLPRTLPNGDFDMTNFTHVAYDDPHYPMSYYTTHSPLGDASDPRGRNNMAFFDDEITAAVDDAEATLDSELLIEKVKDVARLIMETQAPMINLYASRDYLARWHWFKGHMPTSRGTFAAFNGKVWIDTRLRGS
jgi:peptide/nickel transport system substrate-binding protein